MWIEIRLSLVDIPYRGRAVMFIGIVYLYLTNSKRLKEYWTRLLFWYSCAIQTRVTWGWTRSLFTCVLPLTALRNNGCRCILFYHPLSNFVIGLVTKDFHDDIKLKGAIFRLPSIHLHWYVWYQQNAIFSSAISLWKYSFRPARLY